MDDIFDGVSIYKSTDNPKYINTGDAAQRIQNFNKVEGDWCICRFVNRKNPVGWPLHWMGDRGYTSFTVVGPLGWSETEPVAFMTEVQALEIIAEGKENTHYIDRAVHKKDILWRVLLHSSYDSSRVEVYRGDDYQQARNKLAEMQAIVEAAKHIYLEAIFEGATRIV